MDIATRSTNSSKRLEGKRDRALLALLLACGLGRHEAVALRLEHLEQREEHWAIVDLKGKGGHVRTVPVPGWVMEELRVWLNAPGIGRGKIFRRVTKMGRLLGEGMSEKAVWHIVSDSATPREENWSRSSSFWGHISIQTTERYLGCKQRTSSAVNDRIGIEPRL